MADTGFVLPGTGVNRPVAAQIDWSNPANIEDSFSTANIILAAFEISDHLAASNYGFSTLIPAGSTIDGIEVQILGYDADDDSRFSITEVRLILADDSNGSEDKNGVFTNPDTTVRTETAGGATDKWGETITRADVIDVDFGCLCEFSTAGSGSTGRVTSLKMKIYYTETSQTEKLLPNSEVGWAGTVADIDEGIAAADGNVISRSTTGVATIGFDDSAVEDNDIVTLVRPTIRARSTTTGGVDTLNVDLHIGGVKQGVTQTFAQTGSFVNHLYNHAAWDDDWTASEMDGIELEIWATHTGEAQPIGIEVDAIDLDITYTLDLNNISNIPNAALSIAANVPTIVSTENRVSLIATVALAIAVFVPQAVTTENHISQLPKADLIITALVPQAVATENHISNLPTQSLTMAAFVPSFTTSDPNTSQLPLQALTVTGFAPQVVSTENHFINLPLQAINLTAFVPSFQTFDPNTSTLPVQALSITGFVPQAVTTELAAGVICRVSFATPSVTPLIGAGLQKFRWHLRKDVAHVGGSGVPTADFFLYEDGVQRQVLTAGVSITSDAGQTVEVTWDAGNLANGDGSLVEARMVGNAVGSGSDRRTVEVGAVEWCVDHDTGTANISQPPSAALTIAAFVPSFVTFDPNTVTLPNVALTVTAFVPSFVTFDNDVSQLPVQALSITGFVPQAVTTENRFSNLPVQALSITGFVPQVISTDNRFSNLPVQALSITGFAPQVVSTDNRFSNLPLQALTVTGYVPQAVTTENHFINLPAQALSITGFVPQVVTTEHRFSNLPVQALTVTTFVPLFNSTTNFEKITPNAKISDSGHSACLLSDLQTDDANWCIASTITSSTESYVGYPTPANQSLKTGANFQHFIVKVRPNSGNEVSLPTARVELWEAGSLVRAGSNVNVPDGGGTVTIDFFFDAAELSDQNGTDIECKVITVAATEPGFSGSVDTGFICLITDSNIGETSLIPKANLSLTNFVPIFDATELNTSLMQKRNLSVTAYAPAFQTFDPNTSQLPLQTLTVTGFAPQAVTTENHLSNLPVQALMITAFVPQFVAGETNASNIPVQALTLTAYVPQFVAGEINESNIPVQALTLTAYIPQFVTTEGEANASNLPVQTLTIAAFAPQIVTTEFGPSTVELPNVVLNLAGYIPQFTVTTNYEKIAPDVKISDVGHSACLLSDLTAHDANWCIAATITSNTETYTSFPTPANTNLKLGANLQQIEAHFRQFSGNDPSLPSARIELWESGTFIKASSNTSVLSTGERVLVLKFDANDLTDKTGAGVEVKTFTTADTEPGFSGSVDTGFICFRSNSLVPDTSVIPVAALTLTAFVPTFFSSEIDDDISLLPSIVITLTAYPPNFIVQGPRRIFVVT